MYKINSQLIFYNIELQKMNYDQYQNLLSTLADKDNQVILLESIPQKIKKQNKLTDHYTIFRDNSNKESCFKFLYPIDDEFEGKDLFKGYFNSNGEYEKGISNSNFYISSKSTKKNLESKIELMNYIFYFYFKVMYNFNGFEDIINQYLYQVPSWKNIVYANFLTQKEQLIKKKEVLLEIKRKYPSLNSLNSNIINIQGNNSEYFIPTDFRLANIELEISNIETILTNYYIDKARYDFYNKVINELNSFMFKSFNENTNENLYNHLLFVIENYEISSNQNIGKIDIKNISLQDIIDSDKENLIANLTDFYKDTELKFSSKVHINIKEEKSINITLITILTLFISIFIVIILTFIINYIRDNINEIKNG